MAIHGHPGEIRSVLFDIGETLLVSSAGSHVWAPRARETVNHLKSKAIPLGLISNTPAGSTRASLAPLFPMGFFDLFDDSLILLSSEIGLSKPDLRIFFHALGLARIPAAQCLFVTENLEHTLAAQRAGMRALRIKDFVADYEFLAALFV